MTVIFTELKRMRTLKQNEILLVVSNLARSIKFYEYLFETTITVTYKNRWAKVPGSTLLLFNKSYDKENNIELTKHEKESKSGNNCIPVFLTSDIKKEYSRIEHFCDDISEICDINLKMPYSFFTIKDPDGNILEIGHYPAAV